MKSHQNNLKKYYYNFINEDTEDNESILRGMLAIMSKLSGKYYPVSTHENFYCRAVAWIKTSTNENHLICVSSMHKNGKIYHAEEVLAATIHQLYQADARVVTSDSIYVHQAFIDMAPCNGIRYGKDHNCQKFFDGTGHLINTSNKQRFHIKSDTSIYWNLPLPPQGSQANIRSQLNEMEKEELMLGININEAFSHSKHWNKFYISKDLVPQEVQKNEIFSTEIDQAKTSPAIEAVKSYLQKISAETHNHFPPETIEFVKKLLDGKNAELLHKCSKAIANNYTLQYVAAFREISITEARIIMRIKNEYKLQNSQSVKKEKIVVLKKAEKENTKAKKEDIKRIDTEYESTRNPNKEETEDSYTENMVKIEKKVENSDKKENIEDRLFKLFQPITQSMESQDPVIDNFADAIEEGEIVNILESSQAAEESMENLHESTSMDFDYSAEDKEIENKLKPFFNELDLYCKKSKLTHADAYFLVRETYNGFTLLHTLLASRNFEQVLEYFAELYRAYKLELISKKEFVGIFTKKIGNSDLTALHMVLMTKQAESLAVFLKTLETAYLDGMLTKDEYADILTAYTKNSAFSPLSQVLKTGKEENTLLYLTALNRALKDKIIDEVRYKKILIDANSNNYTALHQANFIPESNVFIFYFRVLQRALALGIVTKTEYANLFFIVTKNDCYSPLHSMLTARNTNSYTLFFEAVDFALSKNIFTKAQYKKLLLQITTKKFSPLMCALKKINPTNLDRLITRYQLALKNGVISVSEYRSILLDQNCYGHTPFSLVIYDGNTQGFDIFVKALQDALEQGIITKAEYQATLLEAKGSEFTIVLNALSSCKDETVNKYIKLIKEILKDDEKKYAEALTKKSHGYSILHIALRSGLKDSFKLLCHELNYLYQNELISKEVYADQFISFTRDNVSSLNFALRLGGLEAVQCYCNEIEWLYKNGIISAKDYYKVLLEPNKQGYTPLHQAVATKNLDLLEYFIDTLNHSGVCHNEEFRNNLCTLNYKKQNILHAVIATKNSEILRSIISFIKKVYPNDYKEIFKEMLLVKSEHGYTPKQAIFYYLDLQPKSIQLKQMNAILNDLIVEIYHSAPILGKRSNTNKHDDNAKTKVKKLNFEPEQPITDTSANNNNFSYERHSPMMFSPIATPRMEVSLSPIATPRMELSPVPNENTLLDLETIYKSDDKKFSFCGDEVKLLYKQDTNENYVTYKGVLTANQATIYFIDLKIAKSSNQYNFSEFKPEAKGAKFVLNFDCPPKSQIFLPAHMENHLFTDDTAVSEKGIVIKGNYNQVNNNINYSKSKMK